jgi:hypothetical protein
MISAKLDTRELARALSRLERNLPSQLAQALNSSVRIGRTQFYKEAGQEIGLRRGLLGADAATDLVRASPGRLIVTFKPSRKVTNMAAVGVTASRATGLTAKTHRLTRGSKTWAHGFLINGKAVHRPADNRHKIKALRTTSPAALFAQEDMPFREAFETTVAEGLARTIPVALEKAMQKAGM